MGYVHLSLTAERAVVTPFQVIAVSSTVFRLYRRYKQKSLWWDDGGVLIALLLDLVYCSTIVLSQEIPTSALPPSMILRRVVAFWITGTLPVFIVWFSRISICLSIAKIDMQISISRIRTLFYCLIMAFGFFAFALLGQKIWTCARDTSWVSNPPFRCVIGEARATMSLVGDLVADTALTVLSLNLTWKVRMRPSQRKLLSLIALANILSSMAGIVYGVTDLLAKDLGPHRGLIMIMVLHIKTAVTLTVCNLLVIVTYVYAICHRSSGDTDEGTDTTPATERRPQRPDGGLIKSAPEPGRTVYILTQFDSNGSPIPSSQQGGSTAYTWGGSGLGWLPRPPSTVPTNVKHSQEPSSFSSNSRNGSHPPEISRPVSEPCPRRPAKVYSSSTGSSGEHRMSQHHL